MNALLPHPDDVEAAPHEGETTIDFILLPGFDLLCVAAGLEPLRRVSTSNKRRKLFPRLLSLDGDPVRSEQGLLLPVDGAFSDATGADLTLVFGGERPNFAVAPHLPDQIRRLWRRGRKVGAVQGGIFVLARAGILAGHRFAVHREHLPVFDSTWPSLTPSAEIFCIDRRIVTCAGGIAMADLAVRLIHDNLGANRATEVMQACVITAPRGEGVAQSAPVAPRAQTRNPHLLRAVQWIDQNFLDPDCLQSMPAAAGSSTRQLQRLFKAHLGIRPLQYLTDLRLNHARVLLAETSLSVQEVALACGYNAPGTFAKPFRQKFGVAPSKYSPFSSAA